MEALQHINRGKVARLAALMLVAGIVFASCRLVGQGDLHVANDLSGIGADNTTLRAYAPDPGDIWPPAGSVNLFVKGDDFGRPPAYGMDGYLFLARTDLACPESEGAPEAFTLQQVTLVGIVTVTDGSVNQFITMPDTPAARQARWALIEINELEGFPGLHLVHRCGTVTWAPAGGALVEACSLRTSLEGAALATGPGFTLGDRRWQVCLGGAAAGSNEKLLFRSENGGASWTLISRTTLGNPPAEAGVGTMPNGNGPSALFFVDADDGWMGLSSPGHNLYRTTNGGRDWVSAPATGLQAGVPVTSITFSDATNGTFTTPDGTWTTSNGGASWSPA